MSVSKSLNWIGKQVFLAARCRDYFVQVVIRRLLSLCSLFYFAKLCNVSPSECKISCLLNARFHVVSPAVGHRKVCYMHYSGHVMVKLLKLRFSWIPLHKTSLKKIAFAILMWLQTLPFSRVNDACHYKMCHTDVREKLQQQTRTTRTPTFWE